MTPVQMPAQKNDPKKNRAEKKLGPYNFSLDICIEMCYTTRCLITRVCERPKTKERIMKNPLIINIRCSCIEEYINIQRLHKEYTRQLRTGEIMSVFVGAELAVPGEFAVVDKLMEKGGQCRKSPAVAFCPKVEDIRNITKEFTKADFEELKKEIEKGAVIMSGPTPDEEIALPQAVDGGVDANGNLPLPEGKEENPNSGLADEKPSISEFAVGDRAEEFHCPVETEVHKSFAFEEEPVPDSMFKKVPETLVEPDFSQAAPSVAEESDDGWNGEDHNYTC